MNNSTGKPQALFLFPYVFEDSGTICQTLKVFKTFRVSYPQLLRRYLFPDPDGNIYLDTLICAGLIPAEWGAIPLNERGDQR